MLIASGKLWGRHLGGTPNAPVPAAYGIDESCTFNSRDPCKADGRTANSSTSIIDSAIDFVSRHADVPWYMNVWLHVSHNLLNPSAAQKSACVNQSATCACSGLSDNQTSCAHQIFWSAQLDADTQIGRLLDMLSSLNLNEQTLVAFSTDNGPGLLPLPLHCHGMIYSILTWRHACAQRMNLYTFQR